VDRILFLIYCGTNALVYVLVKYYHQLFTPYSTLEIMGYMNITTLIMLLPYAAFRFRNLKASFFANMKLSISAPASLLKIYCVQYISPKNAMVVSFMMPMTITLLSFITLNEYDKKNAHKYIWLLVSMIGVIMFVGVDFSNYSMIYTLLLLHVFFKSLVNIFLKQLSHNRYEALFYSLFYYAIFACGTFLWYGRFNISMLLKKEILFFALISLICQICLIRGYEMTKKISLLQNLDYSRLIFSCIFTYTILGDSVTVMQVCAITIVIISMYLSQVKNLSKQHILTLGIRPRAFKMHYKRYRRKFNTLSNKSTNVEK